MINKFLIGKNETPNVHGISATLQKLGFAGCSLSKKMSSNLLWEGQMADKKFYIKMSKNGTYGSAALALEFKMFFELNEGVDIRRFELDDYLFIATEELSPITEISTDSVFQLIGNYKSKLSKVAHTPPRHINLDVLLDFSEEALFCFQDSGQLDGFWVNRLRIDVDLLRSFFRYSKQTISHGDLSPSNILTLNKNLILIDWGEAFWAFQGFDELYWLTFLRNSKDLNKKNLKKLRVDIEVCQSAINIIILLKEYLNRSLTNDGNRIPTKLRLEKVQVS